MAEKHSKNLDPKVHFYLFLLQKHKQNHNVKNLISTLSLTTNRGYGDNSKNLSEQE